MPLFVRWLINALALAAAVWLVPSIRVESLVSLFIAAAVIGLLNVFLKPFLIILTLPLNVMTLGLFTFVINGIVLLLAGSIMGSGLVVQGFWSAFWGAIVLSLVSGILNSILDPNKKASFTFRAGRTGPGQRPGGPGQPGPGVPPRQGRPQVRRPRRDDEEEIIDLNQDDKGKWS